LVEKNLPNVDEDVDVVVFKVPVEMRVSSESLKQWLSVRVDAVVKALTTP